MEISESGTLRENVLIFCSKKFIKAIFTYFFNFIGRLFLSLSSGEKYLISGSLDGSINILGVEKLIKSRPE